MSKVIISPIPRKQPQTCFFLSAKNPNYNKILNFEKLIKKEVLEFPLEALNQSIEVNRASNPLEYDEEFLKMNTESTEFSTDEEDLLFSS